MARRLLRATRSGGASEPESRQFAVAINVLCDEFGTGRDGAARRPARRLSPGSCRDVQRRVRSSAHRRAHTIGVDGVTSAPTATCDLRLLACQAGGRGFESRRSRHFPCPSWRAVARPCAISAPTRPRGPPPPSPGPVVQGRATTWQMYSTQVSTQDGGGTQVGGVRQASGTDRRPPADPAAWAMAGSRLTRSLARSAWRRWRRIPARVRGFDGVRRPRLRPLG